jgi:GTP cyclohydrolase I
MSISQFMQSEKTLSQIEKIEAIEHHFAKIMEMLGLDLSEPSLEDTPRRVAKMYVEELFVGLDPQNFPEISYFAAPSQEMIVIKDIVVNSMCEHHFVPMSGKACIAYLPKEKLIGLSKIPRIVEYFCKRPQLQERLTFQIANALSLLLETDDIAVSIEAKHFCVSMRGVKDPESTTLTQDLRGKFKTDALTAQQFFANLPK